MRFKFHLLVALSSTCLLAVYGDTSPLQEPGVTEPTRRYLAADQGLRGQLQNMTLVMGQAQHKQVLWRQFDAAWEKEHSLELGALGRVIRDHEGRYRMYYELMHANAERVTAVAFSNDGIHWTKPALNIAPEIVDHPESNLIRVAPPENDPGRGLLDGKWYRGAHAFYDAHARDPERRYKLLWRQGHDMYVASSADGLHFVTHGRAVDYYADTCPSHFFDPLRNEYVIYGRVWLDKQGRPTIQDRLGADGNPPTRRGVVLHRSPRWEMTPWPENTVKDVLIDPMDVFQDGGWTDIYTPNVQLYHGQYVAFPAVFFRRPLDDLTGTAGPLYPLFMHSHDGRDWSFPDKQHPIIDIEPHLIREQGLMEPGMIFPASNLVERPGELWVYYSARGYQHYGGSPGDHDDVSYNLAVMRQDAFACLQTQGETPGVWRTPAIVVPETATQLHVNANVSGALAVEVLDPASGEPAAGLSAPNCKAFTGDKTDTILTWGSAGLNRAAGQKVCLRFLITDGRIFSFWFE
mgnify:CR=1 FL=1